MKETTKAMRRRMGGMPDFWKRIFKGVGIDIGCGDDPLDVPSCIHFDRHIGDANWLNGIYAERSFDYIHSSHSLEHMDTPDVFWEWCTLLKDGGYAVVTVPSWELYEGMTWPSRFNGDHKSTWSMNLPGSPARHHVHVPSWMDQRRRFMQPILCRQLDVDYDYTLGPWVDQSHGETCEPWIEFVMQRIPGGTP